MLKIANQVIDVHDDLSHEGMRKLAALNPRINVMSYEDRAKLADSDFALSVITKRASKINKFPVIDHDSTWLSNQYFGMNCHKLTKEAAQVAAHFIKRACEKFAVVPTTQVAQMAKEAFSNVVAEGSSLRPSPQVRQISLEKLAAVEEIGQNYTKAQYAFKTPAHVKLACDYFEQNIEKIPLELRHKYAAAIQRRAEELGMGAQKGTIAKYAGDAYSGMVDAHVRMRASLLETQPTKLAQLEKISSMKKEVEPSVFAQALHSFDKQAGLTQYYGGCLKNPYEATFASHPAPRLVKVGKADLTHDELKALAHTKYAKIKEYFGSHLADEMKKDAITIFESLPTDTREVMAGIASGHL